MKDYYKPVELEKIKKIFASRNLDFDCGKMLEQYNRHLSRVILLTTKQEKKLVFKFLLNKKYKFKFSREIEMLKFLSGLESSIFTTNKLIEYHKEPDFWFLATSVDGNEGGNLFEFKKHFVKGKLIKFLINFFNQTISLKPYPLRKEDIYDQKEWFMLALDKIKINQPIVYETLLLRYNKNLSYIEDKNNYCFAHYDLTPSNFFTRDGFSFAIIDWEGSRNALETFDPAYAYARGWRFPSWQKNFFNSLVNKTNRLETKESREVFNLIALLILSIDIETISQMIKTDERKIYRNRKFTKSYLAKLLKDYQVLQKTLIKGD